jgi:hypothetical protein
MEGKELTTTTDGSLMPLVNVQSAVAAWNAYQDLCKQVLDEKTDYANIKGKLAKKRSGFSKLARFYGVSVNVLKEFEWHGGDDWGWDWTLIATLPGGRSTTGDGSCTFSEMKGGGIAATRHNIRAKAYTRAFNRAVANVLGTGEVSAEELGDEDNGHTSPQVSRIAFKTEPPANKQPSQAVKVAAVEAQNSAAVEVKNDWIANPGQRAYFWKRAGELGYDRDQAHAALGIARMGLWEGTMTAAIEMLEKQAATEGEATES